MIEGYYPPRNVIGYLIDSLLEIPKGANMVDYNEFYRLFKNDSHYYIYKVKNPKSPLMSVINKIKD